MATMMRDGVGPTSIMAKRWKNRKKNRQQLRKKITTDMVEGENIKTN